MIEARAVTGWPGMVRDRPLLLFHLQDNESWWIAAYSPVHALLHFEAYLHDIGCCPEDEIPVYMGDVRASIVEVKEGDEAAQGRFHSDDPGRMMTIWDAFMEMEGPGLVAGSVY